MKKLLGITALAAVLLFTAVAGYRQDIDRNSKDEPVSVNQEIKSEKEEEPGENTAEQAEGEETAGKSVAEQAGTEETGTETGQKVQQEYGDLLHGTAERERGIPVDFPFEESEEYSLTLA